jgi:hypothetical protein
VEAEQQHRLETAPGSAAVDKSSRLEDPRWSAVQALVISAFVTVGVLASLVGLLVLLNETSSGPESSLSLVFVAAAVVLILVVCTLTIVLKRLRLTNAEEPMGLPRGSIRAVIALLLILLFFIAAIFLFNSTLLGGERTQTRSLQGIDAARFSAIPTDQIVSASPRTVGTATVYDVVLYPSSSGTPTSDDLAKQLVTTLATLVTAVAAFYFGANSVRGAVKDATASASAAGQVVAGGGPGTGGRTGGGSGAGDNDMTTDTDADVTDVDAGDVLIDGEPDNADTDSSNSAARAIGPKADSDHHDRAGGTPMSDVDTRPGDEIEPLGEGDFDMFPGPDLAEEDVEVDDIHERDETEPGPPPRRSQ